ncbi:MAG: hypothetical protein Q8873_09250 [Bacillota bacterium]|nr:hypothetical protein [Bacillota bacterium]
MKIFPKHSKTNAGERTIKDRTHADFFSHWEIIHKEITLMQTVLMD